MNNFISRSILNLFFRHIVLFYVILLVTIVLKLSERQSTMSKKRNSMDIKLFLFYDSFI